MHKYVIIQRIHAEKKHQQSGWLLCSLTVPKHFFTTFFFFNLISFYFSLADNGETGRWWQKQWLPKYGPFIWLNSTNGPHCLEESYFGVLRARCVLLWGPGAARKALINSAQGVELRNSVLPQIKPRKRMRRGGQE